MVSFFRGKSAAAPPATAAALAALPSASLRRRAACLLYEVVVLFGVALVPGFVATLVGAVAPVAAQPVLGQAIGFLCFGAYFVWMWVHGGQTLPMQTWRLRLVTGEGKSLTLQRAVGRYLAAWLWVLPAILVAHAAGWTRWPALGAAAAWAGVYGAAAWWLPQRQFLHDVLCRTRLVELPG